jgi:hypothetical protein
VKKPKIKPPPNWEDTPQSFERFERLAKGLMAVTKKDIERRPNKIQTAKPKKAKSL